MANKVNDFNANSLSKENNELLLQSYNSRRMEAIEVQKILDRTIKYHAVLAKLSDIQKNINHIVKGRNEIEEDLSKNQEKINDTAKKILLKEQEINKLKKISDDIDQAKIAKEKILMDLAIAEQTLQINSNKNNKELVNILTDKLNNINEIITILKEEEILNHDKIYNLLNEKNILSSQNKLHITANDELKKQVFEINAKIKKQEDASTALKKNLNEEIENTKKLVAIEDKQTRNFERYSKMATSLIDVIKPITSFYFQQEEAVTKITAGWALNNDELTSYRKNIIDTAPATATLYNKTAKDLTEMQQAYTEASGRNIRASSEGLTQLAEMSRILSSNTGAGKFASNFEQFGLSIKSSSEFMEKIMNIAKKSGVNATESLDHIISNLKIATNYSFKNGLESFAQMQIYSDKLKINMNEVAKLADKVSSPQGAIETAAKLQVLGGSFAANADPMRMLYEGINDFAGMTKRYQKMTNDLMVFNKKTGEANFSSGYERIRAQAGAEAMGLDFNEMVTTAQTQAKRNAIEQSGGFKGNKYISSLNPEDRANIENIITSQAQYNKTTGQFQVTGANGNFTDITKLSAQDLEFIKPQEVHLANIARNTLSIQEMISGTKNGILSEFTKMINPIGSVARGALTGGANFLSTNPSMLAALGFLGVITKAVVQIAANNGINMARGLSMINNRGLGGSYDIFGKGIDKTRFNEMMATSKYRMLNKDNTINKNFARIARGKGYENELDQLNKNISVNTGEEIATKIKGGMFSGIKGVGAMLGATLASDIISGVANEYRQNRILKGTGKAGDTTDKWLAAGSGALQGAVQGAMIGSMLPIGISTGIGAAVGGLIGGTMGYFSASNTSNDTSVDDARITSQNRLIMPNGKSVTPSKNDDIFFMDRTKYNQNSSSLIGSMQSLGVNVPIVQPKPIGGNQLKVMSNNGNSGNLMKDMSIKPIDININGTLKLDAGNGNSINLKELINNNEFKKVIANLVAGQLVRDENGGRYKGPMNRNSIIS
jgi:hypothetical protein